MLGACLYHYRRPLDILVKIVHPGHFLNPDFSEICRVMTELHEAGKPVDTLTVCRCLAETFYEMVARLPDACPCWENAEYYAYLVVENWKRRQLTYAADEVKSQVESAEETESILAGAQKRLAEIQRAGGKSGLLQAGEVMRELFTRIDNPSLGCIKTGMDRLDDLIVGLQEHLYYVVAARTSIGKTAFACTLARSVLRQGVPVLYFTFEEEATAIGLRLLAMESGIPSRTIRHGQTMNDAQAQQVSLVRSVVDSWPLRAEDCQARRMNMASVAAEVREFSLGWRGMFVVVIDYLQMVKERRDLRKSANREEAVAQISRDCVSLAHEFPVTLLALSQLNRQAEARKDHLPDLADLRESGSLEQDADCVLLLHRPGFYQEGEGHQDNEQQSRIIVAKQRAGPTGVAKVVFRQDLGMFGEWDAAGTKQISQGTAEGETRGRPWWDGKQEAEILAGRRERQGSQAAEDARIPEVIGARPEVPAPPESRADARNAAAPQDDGIPF